MSWFSQRWRTQRNAILKVNCRIPWIFMFLNACCASGNSWKHACLSVCSPHSLFLCSSPSERNTRTLGLGGLLSSLIQVLPAPKWRDDEDSFNWMSVLSQSTNVVICPCDVTKYWLVREHLYSETSGSSVLLVSPFLGVYQKELNFRTSNQARGPAEFKHITKRRKRN